MKRRLILFGVLAAGVLLAAVALLPWWWGAALSGLGGRAGLEFATYQRIGYGRWALTGVVWRGPQVEVKADRIEAGHPLAWWFGPGRAGGVEVAAWSVEIHPTEDPRKPDRRGGWHRSLEQAAKVRAQLVRWLPVFTAGPGEVRWRDDVVRLAGARWTAGDLEIDALEYRDVRADARARWAEDDPGPRARLTAVDTDAEVWVSTHPAGLEGELRWRDQPAPFAATFGPDGWIPTEARLHAEEWEAPGEVLRIGQQYASVRGRADVTWRNGAGQVDVDVRGVPVQGAKAPPLTVRVAAAGGPERISVEALDLQIPGVAAHLDRPVVIDPRNPRAGAEAVFRLQADLAQLPGARGGGRVEGLVRVDPQARGVPRIQAKLGATELSAGSLAGAEGDLEAELVWPRLTLARARFADRHGSTLDAAAEVDFEARRIEALRTAGQLARATIAPWVPEEVAFQAVAWQGTAAGEFDRFAHQGQATVHHVIAGGLKPLDVELAWTGQGAEADVAATVRAPEAAAQVEARVARDVVQLQTLSIHRGRDELLALVAPAVVRWTPRWEVANLRLRGSAGEVAAELDVVGEGRIGLEAPHLALDWLEDWWREPLPLRRAEAVRWRGVMEDGVLLFDVAGQWELDFGNERAGRVELTAAGGRDGLVLERLAVVTAGDNILRLRGRLPLVLQPAASPKVRIDQSGAFELTGNVARHREFWAAVGRATGINVIAPAVDVQVQGRWSEPRGTLRLAAERIELDQERWEGKWPVLSELRAAVVADERVVAIDQFSVLVEGQPVTAQARVPFTARDWPALRAAPVNYLRERARGHLELPAADVAAFARLVPAYLAPSGQVEARLAWTGDGGLDGHLRLSGAVSRPLGPLGILQDIGVDLGFSGREVLVRNVTARMGGQPVKLTGRAALPSDGSPRLDLKLTGQNVPLVRQTGVLLRGDLDLALATGENGAGRVSGLVRLTDGLFLADLQDVVPRGSGVSRPAARPPYFSVTVDPLQHWRIDVRVEGAEFLRLRTPVLESTASARFQLSGTLAEPRATGEAVLDGGRVRLPFAVFAIEEGEVRLTQADPFEPRLSLTGTSRRLGYDLRMELTGTASDPRLQFSSSPPLASEEILLLVMAGQAPQEEVSYTGSQRAMQIGTFLGRGVISDLFGGSGGDRLTITTGERISRQGRETYRFAYELTPRLSLVGEYDEFDSYNAGVRWQVLPRRGGSGADAAADPSATAQRNPDEPPEVPDAAE